MSKRYICKSKFHDCYHFLNMKITGEKSLLTLPVPSMLKITEIKNDIFFHTWTLLDSKFWTLISLLIIVTSCKSFLYLISLPVVVSQTGSFSSFKVAAFRQTLSQISDDGIPGGKNDLMVLIASFLIKSPP